MLKLDNKYEVYRVISIPILPPVTINHSRKSCNTEFLATYKLESNDFLVDKVRTKYQLLTDSEIQACSHKNARFCTVYSPVFSTSLSNACLINLFISTTDAIRHYCFTQVNLMTLPVANHLFDSTWLIASKESLKLALMCNGQHTELR